LHELETPVATVTAAVELLALAAVLAVLLW
jgi:hypothetical protein